MGLDHFLTIISLLITIFLALITGIVAILNRINKIDKDKVDDKTCRERRLECVKKTVVVIVCLALIFIAAGCKAPQIHTGGKAVLIDGYSSVNLLESGYNPVLNTFTPSVTSIISSGTYSGVPVGTGCKDYLHYSAKQSSSVWNSSVKNSQQTLIFTTGDKALMGKVVDELGKKLAESSTANQENAPTAAAGK